MLVSKGGITYSEIVDQPAIWQQAIKLYNKERETLIWIKKMKFNQVIFLGAGASYYASIFSNYLFRSIARIQAFSFQPSDVYASDTLPFDARLRTLVIAFSRSGQSDETIWAVEHIKKTKPEVQVISVVCQADSPLKELSDKFLVMPEAMDESVIPIRSFSTMVYLMELFAGALGGKADFLSELSKIPKIIDIKAYHDIVSKLRRLQDFKKIAFVGTGANQGLASYASLILKEMSTTTSIAYNSFEFRHNHYAAASTDTLVVHLLSDTLKDQEAAAVRDSAKMRAQALLLGETLDEKVEAGVEYTIKLQSGLSFYTRAMLAIPYLQLIAFQHSMASGKNPDKPLHVVEVVNFKNKPEFLGVATPKES